MHYLIALIYFLLALLGFDGLGSQTYVSRSIVNGVDVLHSTTRTVAGVANITCVRSASGSCHYHLLARDCLASRRRAIAASPCTSGPTRQFALATGASREIAGLPVRFTLCVGPDNDAGHAACETLPAVDSLASRQGMSERTPARHSGASRNPGPSKAR